MGRVGVVGLRHREVGDHLGQGGKDPGHALTGHNGLGVLRSTEAGGESEGAVLHHASSPGGGADHEKQEDEVGGRRDMAEGDGRDG